MRREEVCRRTWRAVVLVIKMLVCRGGCGSIGSDQAGTIEAIALLVTIFSTLSADKRGRIGDAATESTSLSRTGKERFRPLACRWQGMGAIVPQRREIFLLIPCIKVRSGRRVAETATEI